jgi:hypothetical protein
MLAKKDKQLILEAFSNIDVKQLILDHPDTDAVKWFRFGSYIGIDIATKIINELPEKKSTVKKIKVVDKS